MALGLMLTACKSPASSTAGITVSVTTDATFPPFETVDETTRELVGFDIDLMNAIAEVNGWTIEWVDTPFDAALAGVAECQYDLSIAAISITEERLVNMDFSNPYYSSGQVVVVRTVEVEIGGKEDLVGKIVAAQLGTTGELEAQSIADVTYRPYDTYGLAFQDLMNGQVDAVIADTPVALGYVQNNPDELMVVGEQFTGESYAIAVCKDKTELIAPINSALSTLIDNGTVNTLVMTWIAGAGQ